MDNGNGTDSRPLTVNEWFIAIFILALPLVNIVMYFYWAFADGVNVNKRNFCRASLLWAAVAMGIALIVLILVALPVLFES